MMNRRKLVSGLCTMALVPTRAWAQTTERVYRVGFLSPSPAPHITDPLIAALRERGWLVGRNLIVDMRFTQRDPQRAESLARTVVQKRVDVIATHFTATAMAAHRATSTTPIVMASSGFPG